ncbi:molybdenum ABC transporter permease [Elizabethkingia anophelis]|nr:molybdenum ABC transporter permease [Elizabethkingia anophelis]
MDTVTAQLVFGIFVIVVAVVLIYWINRRRFYRRNAAGVEMFSGYTKAISVRFLERVGKWFAYSLIILGVVCIWTYTQMKKDKEKQPIEAQSTR